MTPAPLKRFPHGSGREWTMIPEEPSDPWTPFIGAVVEGLSTAARTAGLELPTEVALDQLDLEGGPEGDVAFPAHRLAAGARRPPAEVAAAIAGAFPPTDGVRSVHATGPYVNVRVDPTRLIRATLDLVFARGATYGHRPTTGGPVCIEHTSANPTGPFHVGRVRNAILGDTLARAARAAGSHVTTQYYVDDMGRQAAMISWIWAKPRDQWPESVRAADDGRGGEAEKPDRHYGRIYPAVSAYLKEHADAAAEVARVVQQVESGTPPANHREITQQILDGMLASLERLGIRFDEFVWESDFLRDGSVPAVLERMRRSPRAVTEPNGALAIDAAAHGLPKESTHVVVQRADGTSLYVTRDVAYHLQKFGRFARVVDVLGQDHQLHARTLDALLDEIGETRRPEFVIYQDITVPEGGRMSTRRGSAVWLDDLWAEAVARARKEVLARREDLREADVDRIAEAVAAGAIRFHIVRVAPEKPVVFRWEDALSFEGRSGPFVQYSYARAASLLRRSGVEGRTATFEADRLSDPEEVELVRVVAKFPRVVAYTARSGHVQALAGYAHELADQFNRFYHAVPVLKSEGERASRIALVAAVRQTLGNALELLGIVPLETM